MDFGGQLRASGDNLVVGRVADTGFFADIGLREGDRIISIDGRPVTSEAEFRRLAGSAQGGVPIAVMRDGRRQEMTADFNRFNSAGGRSTGPGTGQAALGVWIISAPQGSYVMHVIPGSPAEQAGLRRGDWITSVNGAAATDWQGVVQAIADAGPDGNVDLRVARSGESPRRLQARLGGYDHIFANAEDWATIARRYWDSPYQTGFGAPANGGMRSADRQAADRQGLEQRLERLEREMSQLRQELGQGLPASRPNGGAVPPNGTRNDRPNEGQRTNFRPDRP